MHGQAGAESTPTTQPRPRGEVCPEHDGSGAAAIGNGRPSRAEFRAEAPLRLLSHTRALRDGDPRVVLMAHALGWLTRLVPSSLALFYTVDLKLEKFAGEVVFAAQRPLPVGLESTLGRYRQRYHTSDPLSPRRLARRLIGVSDLEDLAPVDADSGGPYVGEYLPLLGMCAQTTVTVRHRGRIVAGVDLLRSRNDPPISASDLAMLRSSQALLEHAYVCALRAPAADRSPIHSAALATLTVREREIAALVAAGHSNLEAAHALSVSTATVKSHLSHVFEKLGVRSRAQLAALMSADSGRPPDQ